MNGFARTLLLTLGLFAGPFATTAIAADTSQRILVMIRYDAIDSMHGDITERYHRPHDYAAGANTERVLDALATDYEIERVNGWPMRSLALHCEVYALAHAADAQRIIARLARDRRVDSAEELQRFRTLTSSGNTYRPLQHALDDLQIDAAHRQSLGHGIRIAVIDSGIDASHPDLNGAVATQRNFTSGKPAAHGTEIAGVIAARGDKGVVGIAPQAELLDLRACWDSGHDADPATCDSFSLAQALDYAVTNGASVINLSLAGPDDTLLDRLLSAANARGITVVAAAPPNTDRDYVFPTVVSSVIAVGLSDDPANSPGAFAIRAPGTDVLTTFPGARYDYASGSSLAAAHVSGIVALVDALHRQLSPQQIRDLLTAHKHLSAATLLVDAAPLH